MNTLLLLHISLMVLSLIATIGSVSASVFSVTISKRFIVANIVTTMAGIICGVILLIQSPLSARCAVLFAYLIAFTATQTLIARRNQRLAESVAS
jgi:hypothetical protein